MSQDVFQLQMDAILEQCPGVIGIHNDMVIFGGGPARPCRKPHQPLKHLPEGGNGTEQQEVRTLKRVSHILWGRVQCTRHASRPQEGPGDHRDDSAHGQATTSVFSRYGKLHGDLHSKPLTSH